MDVPTGVTQEEGHTGFLLRYLPQFVSREGFSRSFPSSIGISNFVYQRSNRSPFVGHFYFLFYFYEEKSQLPGFELTSQRVKIFRGFQPNHPGDRILNEIFPKNEGKRRLKPPATTIILDFWSTGSLVEALDRYCPLSVCDRTQVTITTGDQNLSRI